ncbi:MAG: beta-lactamase family protein [Gemmatimonadales bacterium]|nr:beta-lactamase family protein [Gemmatimonadales bacterium]
MRRAWGRGALWLGLVSGAMTADAEPLAAQRGTPPAAWASVKTFFHETLAAEGVVGGSLMVFHGDSIVGREFFGFADLASRRPVDERTIFHWASITKTLTAIAVMQLRDRGRLGLDDPIVRHVPELRAVHNAFGPMDAITIRQLLSHSAGFRAGTWPWGGNQPWHPFEPREWSQLVAMMPYTEVTFQPGAKFSYSNPGIVYLGRTIEGLTGDDYEVYVDKNVLKPLGMTSSYFDVTPYHLLPDRSNNYTVRSGQPHPNGLDFDTGITVSNSGLNAPLTEMVKYLQFLAGAPGLTPAARGVLARSSLNEMWQPIHPVGTADGDSIGLGFFIREHNGVRLVGHTGSQAGFRAFFYVDPVRKAGMIAAFNTAPSGDARNPTDEGPAKPRIPLIYSGLIERLTANVFPHFRP